jgi:hypothetical protein
MDRRVAEAAQEATFVVIRLWLPARRGALGLVASRIGALRGDIVGIAILDQDEAVAVDELVVDLPDRSLIPMLAREIQEVDGAHVEDIEFLDSAPDPGLDTLSLAERLVEAAHPAGLHRVLVEGVCQAFRAWWSALVNETGTLMWAGEPSGVTAEVAQVGLPGHRATLTVARRRRPFYRREQLQLSHLARIADQAWTRLDPQTDKRAVPLGVTRVSRHGDRRLRPR